MTDGPVRARTGAGRLLRVLDRVVLVLGVVVVVALALLSPAQTGISAMRSDDCAHVCNGTLIAAGGIVTVGGAVLVALAVLVLLAVLRRPGRPLGRVPLAGVAASVAALALGWALVTAAVS